MKNNLKKIIPALIVFLLASCSLDGKKSVSSFPPLAPEKQTAKQQFESEELKPLTAINTKKVKVALFLPLSGKNKDLGWSIFNAAAISIFENDPNGNVDLVLIDSKDDSKETAQAFKEVINRDIKIVIGPVFSSSIEAIENEVKQKKITAISLSNNQQLIGKTNLTGGIFIAGMIPELQVDRLVGYAVSQKKNNFAVIAPSSQYGVALNSAFREVIKRRDGHLITSEFYNNSSDKEIDRAVEHVINSFRIPAELTKSAKLKKDTVISEFDRIYPQVIIIPESGKILSKIVASIKRQNVEERKFILFGTSQWDDASTLDNYDLVGSMFIAPENEKFHNFERTYYQTYTQFPPRITSISYDLVAAISNLITLKNGEVPAFVDFVNYGGALQNAANGVSSNGFVSGFDGIDGVFRFLPNGLVQRNLAVMKVSNGRFETVEKPLEAFLNY